MSYDINLIDPVTKTVLLVNEPHQMAGGTYAIGGIRELSLNITYNYSVHYRRVLGKDGIRSLYGKTGAEAIPILEVAMAALDDDVDENYWAATEGNAKRTLYQLLAMAQMRPDGVFKGD